MRGRYFRSRNPERSPDQCRGGVEHIRLRSVFDPELKPDQREKAMVSITTLAKSARQDKGCLSFNVYEEIHDKNSLFFFEEWASQADIDRHFQTKHVKDFMTKFPKWIVGSPQIQFYPCLDSNK